MASKKNVTKPKSNRRRTPTSQSNSTSKRFYVWADESCDNVTEDIGEAQAWAREFRQEGREQVYVEDSDHIIQHPHCVFCDTQPVLATFTAAQSTDQGRTVTLVDVCAAHAAGWNEGSDWRAPLYPISDSRDKPTS